MLSLLMFPGLAHGQVPLNRYEAVPLAADGFNAAALPGLAPADWEVAAALDFARNPLVRRVVDEDGQRRQVDVVDSQLTLNLLGALGVHPAITLWASLPVNLIMRGTPVPATDLRADGAGLGDFTLGGRFLISGNASSLMRFGLETRLHLPTARLADRHQHYSGDRAGSYELHVLQEVRTGRFTVRLRCGVRLRATEHLAQLRPGTELNAVLSLQYQMESSIAFFAEAQGSTFTPDLFRVPTSPVELLIGPKFYTEHWTVGAAVGPGLTQGFGSPDFRVVVYLNRASRPRVARPHEAVLRAGPVRARAAPSPAMVAGDPDVIVEPVQEAPETLQPAQGLPSNVYWVAPNVATLPAQRSVVVAQSPAPSVNAQGTNAAASPPNVARATSATSAPPTKVGSPPPQPASSSHAGPKAATATSTGVDTKAQVQPAYKASPAATQAPTPPKPATAKAALLATTSTKPAVAALAAQTRAAARPKSAPAQKHAASTQPASKGAQPKAAASKPAAKPPTPPAPVDTDADGLIGAADKCPDKAEDLDDFDDLDGCPEAPAPNARFTCTRIELGDSVRFVGTTATIEGRAHALLDDVVRVLQSTPDAMLVRVEVHSEGRGAKLAHRRQSQERAEAVLQYLTRAGVARERLRAVGMGDERPIATVETVYGRERNERVELHVEKATGTCNREPAIKGFR